MDAWIKASPPHPPSSFAPPSRFSCDWHVLSAPPSRRAGGRTEPSGADTTIGAEAPCCSYCSEWRKITCPSPLPSSLTVTESCSIHNTYWTTFTQRDSSGLCFRSHSTESVCACRQQEEKKATIKQVHSDGACSAQPSLNRRLTHLKAT